MPRVVRELIEGVGRSRAGGRRAERSGDAMKAVEYDLLSPYRQVEQGGEEPDLPSLRVSVGSVVKIALLVLARGGRVRSGEQRLPTTDS